MFFLYIFLVATVVNGRPQNSPNSVSNCADFGISFRCVEKSQCWKYIVSPDGSRDEGSVDLRLDSDAEDIGDDGSNVLNLRSSDNAELLYDYEDETCEWSPDLGLRSINDEELVCCTEEQIVEQCSGEGSRCVLESLCAEKVETSGCKPPQGIAGLHDGPFVCCNKVISEESCNEEDGHRLVPESACKLQDIRSDAPNIADGGQDILDLRQVGDEKKVCCPLSDITCDEENGFKLVPESECRLQTIRSDAPNIADGGQDVLNLREVEENEVCCPINDVISSCDEDSGFKLVPESECKIQTIRSDAPNIADGGQDVLNLREVGEEMVCCPIADVTSCDVNNGFMLVPESECNIETKRSDAPNIADGGQDVLNLREVGDEMVCCPIADVTSCDEDNGFKLVPESECRLPSLKAGAPDIADSGEGILDLREVGDEKEVCCPINDVIDMCDADGFKCVPISQCIGGGKMVDACGAVDLSGSGDGEGVDLRQVEDEEIVCCGQRDIIDTPDDEPTSHCEDVPGYTCVASFECHDYSVDLRQDGGNAPSCGVDLRLDRRQSDEYYYYEDEGLVCCKDENVVDVVIIEDCQPDHICVPSAQCVGDSVDLRQADGNTTSCGGVDLRQVEDYQVRQSTDYYEYYEDEGLVCCPKEDVVQPPEDCSTKPDHVCILASQCGSGSNDVCKGEDESEGGVVDLRLDGDGFVCCHKDDVTPPDCYDLPNHECVSQSDCPGSNVGGKSSEIIGFCDQIDVKEFSSTFDLGPRISEDDDKLVCCLEPGTEPRTTLKPPTPSTKPPTKPPTPPKCRNFPDHRCVNADKCKKVKLLGIDLDPKDAIDIRTISLLAKDIPEPQEVPLCQNERVCCEEPDIIKPPTRATPPPPTTTPAPPQECPIIENMNSANASEGQWPNMCGIYRERIEEDTKYLEYLAGASLITKGVLLTAAHWVVEYTSHPQLLKVRCGELERNNKLDSGEQEQEVDLITVHPSFFDINLYNDVALVHVKSEFDLSKPNIGTIALPSKTNDKKLYLSHCCYATGWGRRGFDAPFADVLKQVMLPIMDHDECQENFIKNTRLGDEDQPEFKLHKSFICAGGKHGEDTCRGDGGGPLMCPSRANPKEYIQTGITSWGIGCGQASVPGAYASVSSSLCFINWATKCKEGDKYINDINIKDCSKNWIDKHIRKLEGHLKHVKRVPKSLKYLNKKEIESIKESFRKQIKAAKDLKAGCVPEGQTREEQRNNEGSSRLAVSPNAKFSVLR